MNLIKTLYRRGIAVTFLLILLLAFSIALFAMGFSAWNTAHIQRGQVDSQYTTVAVQREEMNGGIYPAQTLTGLLY